VGMLQKLGSTDATRTKDVGGHAWVVTGHVPESADPVEIDVDAAGSATAFEGLAKGTCDVGMASRRAAPEEAEAVQTAGFGDIRSPSSENVIGLDGVAVIVSPSNHTRTLTIDEAARLFDGETTTWPPESGLEGAVDVVARDEHSGTYDTFRNLVLGDRKLAASAKRFADAGALVATVANDPHAIGFVGMAQIGAAAPVAISEGGAAALLPSRFTVGTEDYPLSRRLYLYVPPTATHPLAQRLAGFALSAEGQTLVSAVGFVDLSAGLTSDTSPCADCSTRYATLTRGARRLSINFRFLPSSSELDSRSQRDIGRLAALLHSEHDPKIELLGFSDGRGVSDENAALSRDRATRVAQALEAYSVNANTVEGMGSEKPVASNDTPAGRERNRRVEVWVRH
jgi:phosphate transport system substrate-binding protein